MPMLIAGLSAFTLLSAQSGAEEEPVLRLGLIGLDTSHVIAFADVLNEPDHAHHVPRARIVAGYKGGSANFPPSYERIDNFTQRLVDNWDLTLYDSIEELCQNVDAVLLTSVDGRQHLEQAQKVIEAGRPVFVDKPFTASLAEAIELVELAQAHDVPMFSTSALRFWDTVQTFVLAENEDIHGAAVEGPAAYQPGLPDLFWYGIHGAEILFTIMGPDCVEVTRVHTDDTDLVVGRWADGRIGTYRGMRKGATPFRLTVYGEDSIQDQELRGNYRGLMEAVLDTFQTGKPAVDHDETLAVIAFLEAAEASKERGGVPVKIEEVFEAARK